MRTLLLALTTCLLVLPVQAKYSGGSGTAQDPYQIATAADLIALGETPADYDKHFVLTADIDLDPKLPGRKVFDKAVIAPEVNDANWWFDGTPFTAVFDGNSHNISHLRIRGRGYLGLFGQLASGAQVKNVGVVDVNMTGSGGYVGGLVGSNSGTVTRCYSTGEVNGGSGLVGSNSGTVTQCYSTGEVNGGSGLVGSNFGTVTECYSTGAVSGRDSVGGLVGHNSGSVTECYSTGAVSGSDRVGGLVGFNNGSVTRCHSTGAVSGSDSVGGLVGENPGSLTDSYSAGTVHGDESVGGLVGLNGNIQSLVGPGRYGPVTRCYSTGMVSGSKSYVGGLVGHNRAGTVSQCYSTGAISGAGSQVGGLVGGYSWGTAVTQSFWDIQTSGQSESAGGTGKTTAEMQIAKTFLDAGWDFVGETRNGTDDIWTIVGGKDYPRLAWECWAAAPFPASGALDVVRTPTLKWTIAPRAAAHDVYFGEDKNAVTYATPATLGIYRGRPPAQTAAYEPGTLEWAKTYYWRIDEVNEADPRSPWKGAVWSFTTTACIKSPQPPNGATDVFHRAILSWVPGEPGMQYDVYLGQNENDVRGATPETPGIYRGRQASDVTTYQPGDLNLNTTYYWRIDGMDRAGPQSPWKGVVWSFATGIGVAVVDDFESYTDEEGRRIYQTWIDGPGPDANTPGNGTASIVGNMYAPFAERTVVHGGRQSMPMDYNNMKKPWYSEVGRTWATPHDWTVDGADTLTLYFRGKADDGLDPLYAGIEDSAGRITVVVHPDAKAVLATEWQKWQIALADVRAAGVDVAAVKKMVIGVGDRKNPKPGGTGRIYIDDIRLTKRMP